MSMNNAVKYKCRVCSFSLWHPISHLGVSILGLYNDARFPGRCLLVLEEHAEDFAELEEKVSQAFVTDAQTAARAIRKATGVPRINYAILGNEEPHVHFHLIPRGHANDPIRTRPPWEHPNKKVELPDSEIQKLIGDIQLALSQIGVQVE